jgi:hypothetical protein
MESSVTLNTTKLNELMASLEKLKRKVVKIGVLNNPEQAYKAMRNEFGFVTDEGYLTPARSNVRFPIESNEGMIMDALKSNLKDFSEESIYKSLNEAGKMGLKAIDMAFDTQGYGTWKDNAPMTIAEKGKNSPLIDTGELRKSYSYEVVNETTS